MKRYYIGLAIFIMMSAVGCGNAAAALPVENFPVEEQTQAASGEREAVMVRNNTYDTLNVATYLTRIGDTYYLADCYHDQILYHDNLTDPLTSWQVLTDEVHYAHTIAGDGDIILIDDTENNRLLSFHREEEGYTKGTVFENIGMKPHYVQYDAQNKQFLAWSSITGEMFYLKKDSKSQELYIEKTLQIPELYGVYVRSFTIMGNELLFVSGHNNQKIIRTDLETLTVKDSYPVPAQIAGMVQLTKIQDYYYITISTDNTENQDYATIIRTKSLEDLSAGDYEDVYQQFKVSGGTPYYITCIDGRYYMAHHRTAQNIIAFDVTDNVIGNVEVIY